MSENGHVGNNGQEGIFTICHLHPHSINLSQDGGNLGRISNHHFLELPSRRRTDYYSGAVEKVSRETGKK